MQKITFSIDKEKRSVKEMNDSKRLAEKYFNTKHDPNQIPTTNSVVKWINDNIPECVCTIKSEDKVIGFTFIIPCNKSIMSQFLKKEINENQLFKLVKKSVNYSNFDTIYLCSVFIIPEFRGKDLASKACIKSIQKITKIRKIKPVIFFDAWTKEGKNLAYKISKLTKLEIKERK